MALPVVVPIPASYGMIPLPGQAFVKPDGLFHCGCGNIPEYGGFHPSDRAGKLMAGRRYINGEENPAWEGYYLCGGCGQMVVDARVLVFPPS